jgi:hypothetical protein
MAIPKVFAAELYILKVRSPALTWVWLTTGVLQSVEVDGKIRSGILTLGGKYYRLSKPRVVWDPIQ